MYSAIKIIANDPLLNSVLNPETNSLSPSAKSKGVRLSSAKEEINHIKIITENITKGINFCVLINFKKLKLLLKNIIEIIINTRETS